MGYYILDGKKAVKCDDMVIWAKRLGVVNRQVAKTVKGDITVSTVFLGIDHRMFSNGPPLLFETMIFGGAHDESQWRYATWDEAEKGHKKACELAGVTHHHQS